jgi:capsular polysaccharide transport system permease protein
VSEAASRPPLIDCARIQLRVIGALVIREMHSRFGRHRFGYVALFVEPLLLAGTIALIHQTRSGGEGIRGNFEFFSIGYLLFFNFRGIVTRSSGTIPSNTALLYHRQVTLPDIFYARHLIESISCTGVMAIFVVAAVAFGGDFPDSPVKMLAAMGLMLLLAQGLALMIGAATSEWHGIERAIHVLTYLSMPISGLFFMVDWLPSWMQEIVVWVPMVHIFELLRDGQFGDRFRPIYDLSYVAAWIMATHLVGLAGLRVARRRLGLE